jgi:uncharacterized protein YcsI (UPF0317 family)
MEDWKLHPRSLRQKIRTGEWTQSTSGLCPGYAQANLVVLPREFALDFLLFCQRNPKPCPIMEVADAGDPILKEIAPGADLRTDLPAYRIFENGSLLREVPDLQEVWRDDLVSFLLGCSHTFDAVLHQAEFPLPHFTENKTPCVFTTHIPCKPAGIFSGPLVVTARAIAASRITEVVLLTSKFNLAHGTPVHIGYPEGIGISDLSHSEYGGLDLKPGPDELPVFWACGVTPQAVAVAAKIPWMITHKPGHMFVCDLTINQITND